MARSDGLEVVDADSHVYEPEALWDFVPDADRARATDAFFHRFDADGSSITTVNGEPAKEMNRRKLIRQAVWKPGMSIDHIGALDPDTFVAPNPGASDARARLADMDEMGVDQAIVHPTLFLEYLPQVKDAEAAAILARAYNDWVAAMSADGDGRLHPVAVLPMQSPTLALEELERVGGAGFRSALMRPAFYTLADAPGPVFIEGAPYRPVWERIAELGLVAVVHPGANITGVDALSSGGFTERVSDRLGLDHTVAEPIAYMQDADLFMTTAFFHGLFEDLPDLKVAIAHAGTTWVPLALEKCETYLWLGGGGGDVSLEPEEVWEAQAALTTFDSWETPVARMPERIGNKAAWGSRYPHHDAAGPDEAIAMLREHGVEPDTIARLMGGHAAQLFGLRVGAGV
jgi:predicted TIM-barrel fold metal-dependent hydrolase